MIHIPPLSVADVEILVLYVSTTWLAKESESALRDTMGVQVATFPKGSSGNGGMGLTLTVVP